MNKPVRIYGIFFNASDTSKKYCYIGSTARPPELRFVEHECEALVHKCNNMKCNVWRKYGVRKFVVFKCITNEHMRLQTEQCYYNYFAKHGYELVNAVCPKHNDVDYDFISLQATRAKISTNTRLAMQRPEVRERTLANLHIALQTDSYKQKRSKLSTEIGARPDVKAKHSQAMHRYYSNGGRQEVSAKTKLAMQRPEVREKMLNVKAKHSQAMHRYYSNGGRQEVSAKTKLAMQRPEVRERYLANYYAAAEKHKAAIKAYHSFKSKYGKTYRYRQHAGRFAPWISFVICNDTVIAYVWDTRVVQFTCHTSELPSNDYIVTKDSHTELIWQIG